MSSHSCANNATTTSTTTREHLQQQQQQQLEIALTHFRAGVTATLRTWGALRAAIDGEWGGVESHDKAEDLRTNILEYFDGTKSEPMTMEELEDNLVGYMEDEFSVVLEDNSERYVSSMIQRMYEHCSLNNQHHAFTQQPSPPTLVVDIVREASKLKRTTKQKVVLNEDSDMDSDSDEDEDCPTAMDTDGGDGNLMLEVEEGDGFKYNLEYAKAFCEGPLFEGGRNRNRQPKYQPPLRQLGEAPCPIPEVEVDEDGFAPVSSRRGRKGKK